jgi:phosphatidylserine/phosphatidylglycerophosphate/cardiolipin synthase-like enzyme
MSGSDSSLRSRVDSIVGDGVEAAVRAKHLWRLRRLVWDDALAPPDAGRWAMGDRPPRDGCSLDALVDGAEAFPSIAQAIESARDHVHVTGWHIAPYFELTRGEHGAPIGELLAEAAERIDVRVLVWAGAPVPAIASTPATVQPRAVSDGTTWGPSTPVAHRRLGEPQRSFVAQRHRDERRNGRPQARAGHPAPVVGKVARTRGRDRRRRVSERVLRRPIPAVGLARASTGRRARAGAR